MATEDWMRTVRVPFGASASRIVSDRLVHGEVAGEPDLLAADAHGSCACRRP